MSNDSSGVEVGQ